VIQAFRLAEHEDVVLPVMISYNAFILSHTSMPVEIPKQEVIDDFLGKYKPKWKLDVNNPITFGNIIGPVGYYRVRRAMQKAQDNTKKLIPQISKEWKEKSGYYHGDLLEYYKCDNAEHILLSMGAIGAESKVAIDEMRKKGIKIGLARVRTFRPSPKEEFVKLSKQADLIVIDRNISLGMGGALFSEVKSALYNKSDAKVHGLIAGIGGKDVTYKDIMSICKKAMDWRAKESEWYPQEV
jgi:pyruvate/2-oxoacid:ferredoxin oxidoreductase alpha subunit